MFCSVSLALFIGRERVYNAAENAFLLQILQDTVKKSHKIHEEHYIKNEDTVKNDKEIQVDIKCDVKEQESQTVRDKSCICK